MMKQLVKTFSLTALAFVLLISNISGVYAAPAESAESELTFEIEEGNTGLITDPVDPEHPEFFIDPHPDKNGENGVTGNTGILRIDYISDFSFGKHKMEEGEQEVYASLISANAEHTQNGRIKVPNYIQVSDLRGTGEGWTLSVKQDNQFRVMEGEQAGMELEGARLSLNNITSNTAMEDDEARVLNGNITFDAMDSDQKVMTAVEGYGYGIHVAHFGAYNQGAEDSALTSVVLNIPASATKTTGAYQTTLTWTLSNVPENEGPAELDHISITEAPDKTSYFAGQTFDPEGMVVTAYYTDGTAQEVADYTWTPEGELSTDDSVITVSYTEGEITKTDTQMIDVTAKTLTSIAITKAPDKTEYTEGDRFSAAGMVVTAYYNDGSEDPVTNYSMTPNGTLSTSNNSITVSYTEGGVTKTASQAITVKAKVLTSIAITTKPSKVEYTAGERFSTDKMVVTAYYNNNTNKKVTNYTWSPSGMLTTANKTITVSYTENGVTKTATVAITVKSKDEKEIDSIEDKEEFDEIEIDGDTWIILSKNKSAGTAELLHKKGLDQQRPFHVNFNSSWTWGGSDMRTYLNKTYSKTLSADFKSRIVPVKKNTILSRTGATQQLDEEIYLLSLSEYNKYETAFKGTLYKYGLDSTIKGWWLRDSNGTANGVWYVITNVQSGAAYAVHGSQNNQGVRPAVTVKYKK